MIVHVYIRFSMDFGVTHGLMFGCTNKNQPGWQAARLWSEPGDWFLAWKVPGPHEPLPCLSVVPLWFCQPLARWYPCQLDLLINNSCRHISCMNIRRMPPCGHPFGRSLLGSSKGKVFGRRQIYEAESCEPSSSSILDGYGLGMPWVYPIHHWHLRSLAKAVWSKRKGENHGKKTRWLKNMSMMEFIMIPNDGFISTYTVISRCLVMIHDGCCSDA